MKNFTALVIAVFVFGYSNAQLEVEWEKTIGGNSEEYLKVVQQTNDGGYILGGYSNSNISGDKTENTNGDYDYWVVKLDSIGNIQWQNSIGGTNGDQLKCLLQTFDGGYILGGESYSGISGDKTSINNGPGYADYWIVKLDSIGSIEWQKDFGTSDYDVLNSLQQTSDGGYILGGNIWNSNDWDCYVLKTDSSGNMLWDHFYYGDSIDWITSIEQTSDGGYVLGAASNSNIAGDKNENTNGDLDYWIIKTDSLGNIQWQNTIGGNRQDYLVSAKPTLEGGYILGGYSRSPISGDKTEQSNFDYDYWIVKVDDIGNIQWQNTIGGNSDDYLYSLNLTSDGGYILGGSSISNSSGDKTENNNGMRDYWVVKIDSVGNVQSQKTIGGSGYDELTSMQQVSDGGYILGGTSNSNMSGDKSENSKGFSDYWVVKLTDKFNLITGKTFIDFNNNQVKDSTDISLEGQVITESNTNRISFTGQTGNYSLAVHDSGNFSVSPVPLNSYNTVPILNTASFTGIHQSDSLNDFAFQPILNMNDLQISIIPLTRFRSGFNALYILNYKNVGTTTLTSEIVFYLNDPNYTYVSASVTPSLITLDSVQWDSITLTPWQEGNITVTVHVNAGIPLGTQLNSYCVINPVAGDIFQGDNYGSWKVFITGAADPNEKLVSEDTLTTSQLAVSPYLDYIIRFQNTGNDTAFNVRVLDNISPDLDLSTFQIVASSHPFNMTYKSYSRLMTFTFDNILLPDSGTNELASHGFIHYRIKPFSNFIGVKTIQNKSFIYFDFNTPEETNTVYTTVTVIDCNTLASINFSSQNFCLGSSVNATATFSYPSTVTWYVDSVFVSNNQTISIANLSVGSHQIKLTATNAYCTQDVISNITINALPPKPLITQTLALLTSSAATGNQWYMNGNIIAGATNTSYTVALDGWYYVEVTDINGCTNVSDSIYMMVSLVTENQNSNGVKLIPNPVRDEFDVWGLKFEVNDEVTITDAVGKIVYHWKISQPTSNLKFQTSNFIEGIYFVNVRTKTQQINLKLIKL